MMGLAMARDRSCRASGGGQWQGKAVAGNGGDKGRWWWMEEGEAGGGGSL